MYVHTTARVLVACAQADEKGAEAERGGISAADATHCKTLRFGYCRATSE